MDPLGRFAYVANKGDDSVSGYSIGPHGALTPIPGSPFTAGSDPVDVAVDPSSKFVYVANASSNNVSAYSIGPNGALTPLPSSPFPARTEPISVVITRSIFK